VLKPGIRRIPGFFIFLAINVAAFAGSARGFYVFLESNTVKEGGIIKLTIGAPKAARAADIEFMGKTYPAFFKGYKVNDRDMVYTAMVPVALGTKGRQKLTIKVLMPQGIEHKDENINIKKILEVKSEVKTGGRMNKELLETLRRENRIIHAAVEPVTAVRYELPFINPAEGEISTVFGASRSYDGGEAGWRHKGIDIAAKTGTNVKASNHGTVVLAAAGKAYGNSVIVDHGGGIYTLYFHMHRLFVKKGDRVAKGDVIGTVGSTGLSTGPHLHYQMDLFSVPVNPAELSEIKQKN